MAASEVLAGDGTNSLSHPSSHAPITTTSTGHKPYFAMLFSQLTPPFPVSLRFLIFLSAEMVAYAADAAKMFDGSVENPF